MYKGVEMALVLVSPPHCDHHSRVNFGTVPLVQLSKNQNYYQRCLFHANYLTEAVIPLYLKCRLPRNFNALFTTITIEPTVTAATK
jgi:hypothetical protein